MGQVETRRVVGGDVRAVGALVAAVEAERGETALDHARLARALAAGDEAGAGAARATGRPGSSDVIGVAAWEPGRARPVAYAQVSWHERRWDVELVVDPERRADAPIAATTVLVRVLDAVRSRGGGQAYLWVSRPGDDDDRMARAAGFEPDRDLWQMVRPLPAEGAWSLATRPFVPGQDEAAWVEVNNRAFHWHPEQGGWTVEDVRAREREPWFDAAGFLLHEREGRLAGFCWTKVHDRHDPPLGEIYVIAVDPDFTGLGLGRQLTLAGLDHLAGQGLPVGMLYVDATNTPAVGLYRSLGFTVDHSDRAYAATVPGPG